MNASLLAIGGAIAAATVILTFLYRFIWQRWIDRELTPAGFGVILGPALLVACSLGGGSPKLIASISVLTAVGVIYWLDDLREIGAWLRVGLCAATGAAVGVIYFVPEGWPPFELLAFVVVAAVITIATVNTVNFQDGADLNLATFLALTAGMLSAFVTYPAEWQPVAVACLAVAIPFAVFNSRPRSLYFGDSGCFVVGTLFTVFGAAFLANHYMPPPEAAIPAALAVVDTAFVTAKRIAIRHKFTQRHYFHLYQRLQRSHRGFAYLLPQPINALLCLGAALLLQSAGMGRILSVGIACVVVSTVVFVVCYRYFVTTEPGPPLPREARV